MNGIIDELKDKINYHQKQLDLLYEINLRIEYRLKLTENFVKILGMTQIGSLIGIAIICIGKYFE